MGIFKNKDFLCGFACGFAFCCFFFWVGAWAMTVLGV